MIKFRLANLVPNTIGTQLFCQQLLQTLGNTRFTLATLSTATEHPVIASRNSVNSLRPCGSATLRHASDYGIPTW